MQKHLRKAAFILLALVISGCAWLAQQQGQEPQLKITQAAVASAHPLATAAGMQILEQGGNAFDAAIAVAAALGVVEPYSAGIGGGSFWLLYDAQTEQYRFIDARETAPQAAHKDYFLNEQGYVVRDKAINGPTAAGIPGQVAAFEHIQQNYGRLPLKHSLASAIQLANQGFAVDERYRNLLNYRQSVMQRYPATAAIYMPGEQIPELDTVLQQPQLGNTLARIAEHGANDFYQGEIAQKMLRAVQASGGDWTAADLANYQIKEREPLLRHYGQMQVVSAPPPSSGGIALFEMLNMLNHFEWKPLDKVRQTHLLVEIMRRAYFDRAEYLGDPDFVEVPIAKLLSEERAEHWVQSINMNQATVSLSLNGLKNTDSGTHTSHFSVLDAYGNMAAVTQTINLPFGAGYVAGDTGVLLNSQMDDFSAKSGEPNAYGLVGNDANAIAPGKRPLSSMTPTIINGPDGAAILGTPGGSRIISMVFLGMLEYLKKQPVEQWVSKERFHHQYLPDVIEYEPEAFTGRELGELAALGHLLKNTGRKYGNMQAIYWDKKAEKVSAAADPRGLGAALVEQQENVRVQP